MDSDKDCHLFEDANECTVDDDGMDASSMDFYEVCVCVCVCARACACARVCAVCERA